MKPVKAVNPVIHVSPKPSWLSTYHPYDKRPSARNIENGYFLALVEEQIDVDRQLDYRHNICEIVSEAGIQNGSQISVSFDPTYERLDFHQIIVWRDNKPQNRLNAADFKITADEEDFSRFIYQGSYSATYIIPDIRKGDRIEFAYSVTGRNPVFGGKFCENIYLQGGLAIAHQYTSLQVSPQRKLNMKSFNKVPNPVIADAQGEKRYTWESFQVEAADDPGNAPGWYNPYARVQVTEYTSWADVINWALKVNPVSTALKGELAQRVIKLKAEAGTDQEKYFREAVKIVQNEVRYMGVEIGQYSHRANQPENVFKQRYGDCKDKALLLASMLRADGIDADMVLVNTSVQNKLADLLPTTNAFNHAVVVAMLKGKQVWVDATVAYQGGKGTDIYFPHYGLGLQLKAGNNGLVTIPFSPTGKVETKDEYQITDEKSKVQLEVTTTYSLNQADNERSQLASDGISYTEKNYLKYYAKIYPKIESRDTLIVKDDIDKNELVTIERYSIPDFFKRDSVTGKYEAGFYANCISETLPTITTQTKNPIATNFPDNLDYTINVTMPLGWNINETNYSLKRDAYDFESEHSVTDKTLSLHYRMEYLKGTIPVDQLEQARQDIALLKDSKLSYNFSYTPSVAIKDGNYRLNAWMMVMVALILVISTGAAIWIYRLETPAIVFSPGASFTQLGGWLILVLIGLFLTPINILRILFTGDYFNLDAWYLYVGRPGNFAFRAILVWEAAGNTILICAAIFCLVLMLNKRDILPKVITYYFAFSILFTLVDLIFASGLNSSAPTTTAATALFRCIIIGAIWIPYFRVSTRVQETFIVPQPSNNFSYEEHEPASIE